MSDDRENRNPFFVAGVITSLFPVIVFIILVFAGSDLGLDQVEFLVVCEIFMPVAALVFSIAGLAVAKKQQKGITSGVVFVIVSAVEVILVALFLFAGLYLSKATGTPPGYTIQSHNPDIESINEEIGRETVKQTEPRLELSC